MTGRALTIVSVAYPLAPVSPNAIGGAEQILSALDRAIVAAGHRSIVVAQAGSKVMGDLLALPPTTGAIDDAARARGHCAARAALRVAMPEADVIHMHGIDFADYLPPPGRPVLATLHLPPDWYPSHALSPARPETWLTCVSASQNAACPASACLLPPIANGVPVAALAGCHAKRRFALMLGRICPEKGQHIALDAAHAAGLPLLIAGDVYAYPAHLDYLEQEVRPRLDRCRRWVGPADFARKRRLLSAARCLVVPSLAAETSSLVAMEALACGTPVVALRTGALPEIVEHGVTGLIVDEPGELAGAMVRARGLDPEACRAAARARFDERRMTATYLALYERLAA